MAQRDSAGKLQRGLERLGKAGDDSDILSIALLALHGALEDHFRNQLAAAFSSDQTEQQRILSSQTGWKDLLDLWESRFSLTERDKNIILSTNTMRNEVAHGGPYTGRRGQLEEYARLVTSFMGVSSGVEARPEHQHTRTYSPAGDSRASRGAQTRSKPAQRSWKQLFFILFLAGLTYLSFLVWSDRGPSLLISALVFLALYSRRRALAAYVWIGGLSYGYLIKLLGISGLTAAALAVVWPVTVGLQMTGNLDAFTAAIVERVPGGIPAVEVEATDLIEENIDSPPGEEFSATSTPMPANQQAIQIRVDATSNVRAGPGADHSIVGTAAQDTVYTILEENPDRTWYKIRLENGAEGWIGSSRVTILP